jgi:TPR repeat protein
MSINRGNSGAMNNLAFYYKNIEQNYTEAVKYYCMAIDHGYKNAKSNLNIMLEKLDNMELYSQCYDYLNDKLRNRYVTFMKNKNMKAAK